MNAKDVNQFKETTSGAIMNILHGKWRNKVVNDIPISSSHIVDLIPKHGDKELVVDSYKGSIVKPN